MVIQIVLFAHGGGSPPPKPRAFLKAIHADRNKASRQHHVCSKGWLYRSFRSQMGGGHVPPHPPPPPAFSQGCPCLTAVRHFRSMLHVHGMLSLLFMFVLRIFPQVFIMHRVSSFPSSESSFHDYQTRLPH